MSTVKMASAVIHMPPALDFTGNTAKNYRNWKKLYDNYMLATNQTANKEPQKIATLFNVAGQEAILRQDKIQKSLTDDEKKDYAKVVAALKAYCESLYEYNETYERFVFQRRDQQEGESFEHFYAAIQELVLSCNYADHQSKQIRDRLVQGIKDKALQETLLRVKNLTEEKVVEHCRAAAASRKQVQGMTNGNRQATQVHTMNVKKKNKAPQQENEVNSMQANKKKYNNYQHVPKKDEKKGGFKCIKCDTRHPKYKCPAYGQTCDNCKASHHFTKCCRWERKTVSEVIVNRPNLDEDDSGFVLHGLKRKYVADTAREWREVIKIENHCIQFKLDPGSDVNTISLKILKWLEQKKFLRKSRILISPYGSTSPAIIAEGEVLLTVSVRGKNYDLDFVVIDDDNITPVISKQDCERLNLVKRIHAISKEDAEKKKQLFIEQHKEVFEGTGKFPGQIKIVLEDGAQVKRSVPHRIPQHLRERLKPTLEDHERRGIIEKVTEITADTVMNNLVIREKQDESLRICLDPTELNKVIKIKSHFLPTLEDIQEKMVGKEVFSVLDLKEGFYHCELDEESQKLCTFVTPWGIYRFRRLPFGLASAPEEFQARNEDIFGNIPGVSVYIDDLCVAGETEEDHDRAMAEVMKRAVKNNIKLKAEKLQYKQGKVKYVGHIFSADGHQPDPDRVNALVNMPAPKNLKELETMMGMFNYVRLYIPHMADISAPLNELKKKDRQWVWTTDQERAFSELKTRLAKTTLLYHFDPNKLIEMHCDASKCGLGVCLFQESHPVAFASRSMNSSELNYSQSEKEMLAIAFGFKKFHNLLYGRYVKVYTDHKSLIPIMNKPVATIGSDRLKRLRLKIIKYKFDIEYVPGPQMYVADHLSRVFLPETEPEDVEMVEVVHSLTSKLPVCQSFLNKIISASESDPVVTKVKKCVVEGWPNKITGLPIEARSFWQHQDKLHIDQGILLKDQCIVVPVSIRSEVIKQLHEGHGSVQKTVGRAKMSVYWPNYVKDISDFVSACRVCEKYKPRKTMAELKPHEIPDIPWYKLGLDLVSFGGRSYLTIIDYFSKWLEIVPVKDKSAASVIKSFQEVCFTHGYPTEIVSLAKRWDAVLSYHGPQGTYTGHNLSQNRPTRPTSVPKGVQDPS